MTVPAAEARDAHPRRTRFPLSVWVAALAVPIAVTTAAVVVQLAWLPELPDPIATHWGPSGGPDGFGPAWSTIVLTAGIGYGITALLAVFLLLARGAGPTPMHKLLAASSITISLFLAAVMVGSLAVQRGLADAHEAGGIGGWLIGGAVVALLAGTASWFLLPKAVAPNAGIASVDPIPILPGERSVWIATTQVPGVVRGVVAVVTCLVLALAVAVTVASDGRTWPLLLVPVVLFVLCAVGLSWRVRVDPAGFTVVTWPLGVPRLRIPVGGIARVETGHVEPLSDFGGWGWRWAPGRGWGVVARRGEAIEITRVDGRRFTVGVDDAATGAALLAGYVASAAGRG